MTEKIQFFPGKNIAMKVPSKVFKKTIEFYREVIGLKLIQKNENSCMFEFGDINLWIDEIDDIDKTEIWLELNTNNIKVGMQF